MIELPSIQQLENFIIYSQVKDFALAAEKAGVTQSAFRFQMKKLEEVVGAQLISHNNKNSELTEDGKIFLSKVENIVDQLKQAVKEVNTFSGEQVCLSVGALMSLGDVLLDQHLTYFKKYNANIKINLSNLEATTLLSRLKDDSIDIISTFTLENLNPDEYENIFFCNERMVYYAPNIQNGSNIISIEEICQYPLVQYSPYYLMYRTIKAYFKKYGYSPEIEAWFSTPYAIMHYCQQNQVGAVLSERLLNAMGFYDGYYEIDPDFSLKCHLLYKKSNPKYRYIKIFTDYIDKLYNNK